MVMKIVRVMKLRMRMMISSGSMRKRKKIFARRRNFKKLRFSFLMKPKLLMCFIRRGVADVKTFAFRQGFNDVATKLLPA